MNVAYPAYSEAAYAELNNNEPLFSDAYLTTQPFEYYSELDSLGRCGTAFTNICADLLPTEERGEIGNIRPTGWHTVNYHEPTPEPTVIPTPVPTEVAYILNLNTMKLHFPTCSSVAQMSESNKEYSNASHQEKRLLPGGLILVSGVIRRGSCEEQVL